MNLPQKEIIIGFTRVEIMVGGIMIMNYKEPLLAVTFFLGTINLKCELKSIPHHQLRTQMRCQSHELLGYTPSVQLHFRNTINLGRNTLKKP